MTQLLMPDWCQTKLQIRLHFICPQCASLPLGLVADAGCPSFTLELLHATLHLLPAGHTD